MSSPDPSLAQIPELPDQIDQFPHARREAGTDSVVHVLESVCVGGAWWTRCRCGVVQAGQMTTCPVEDAIAECIGSIERAYRISEREQGELFRAALHSVPVGPTEGQPQLSR